MDSQSPGIARTTKSLSVAWKEGQRQPRKASTGKEVQYLKEVDVFTEAWLLSACL